MPNNLKPCPLCGEMTEADKLYVIYALTDMVLWFGRKTRFCNQDAVCDGGIYALESAFWALELCGCPTNINGTITVEKLWEFSEMVEEAHAKANETMTEE